MTLIREIKRKIEEEEEYRQKIREQEQYRQHISTKLEQPKKSSLHVWILFIILLAVPTAFAVYMSYEQPTTEPVETASTTQTTSAIGKYAFNKTNGAYRGMITAIKPCTTNNQISCYVVEREGSSRPEEAPIDNTDVRNTR